MCRLSIIIPVYNVENYLIECLNSVLMQKCDDFEVLLIDDGSTDKSGRICDIYAYEHKNFKVIHQRNMGLSEARNTGIQNSKGEYLIFLDSDDYWCVDFLFDLIKKRINGRADIILCQYMKLSNNCVQKISYNWDRDYLINHTSHENYVYLFENQFFEPAAWTKICKRKWLIENNLLFKKEIKSEDIEWSLRIIKAKPVLDCYDTLFYVYRQQRKGSISNSFTLMHAVDLLKTIHKFEKYAEDIKDLNNALEIKLLDYCAYWIMILLYYQKHLEKINVKQYKRLIMKKLYLLQYAYHRRQKAAKIINKYFGYEATVFLIGIIKK